MTPAKQRAPLDSVRFMFCSCGPRRAPTGEAVCILDATSKATELGIAMRVYIDPEHLPKYRRAFVSILEKVPSGQVTECTLAFVEQLVAELGRPSPFDKKK